MHDFVKSVNRLQTKGERKLKYKITVKFTADRELANRLRDWNWSKLMAVITTQLYLNGQHNDIPQVEVACHRGYARYLPYWQRIIKLQNKRKGGKQK